MEEFPSFNYRCRVAADLIEETQETLENSKSEARLKVLTEFMETEIKYQKEVSKMITPEYKKNRVLFESLLESSEKNHVPAILITLLLIFIAMIFYRFS